MTMTVRLTSMTAQPVKALICVWLNSRQTKKPNDPWTIKNLLPRTLDELMAGQIPTFGQLFPRVWKSRDERVKVDYLKELSAHHMVPAINLCDGDQEQAASLLKSWMCKELEDLLQPMLVDAFFEVAEGDWPIAEFVTFNFSFANCPAMFIYHLDRQRDAAFWEMSGRVRGYEDMATSEDYFVSSDIAANPLALAMTKRIFELEQETYSNLLKLGIRKESARGHIGVHAHSTADMAINLRVLRDELKKRTCWFAQSDYWGPAIAGMIQELLHGECSEMPNDPRTAALFGALPCDGGGCKYKFDAMERLENKDRPICPVLYTKFLTKEERAEVDPIMESKYGHAGFSRQAHDYLTNLGRSSQEFDVSVEHLLRK